MFEDPGSAVAGRIVVEVFRDVCPRAAENFLCLCTGERGVGKASKKPLHYKARSPLLPNLLVLVLLEHRKHPES